MFDYSNVKIYSWVSTGILRLNQWWAAEGIVFSGCLSVCLSVHDSLLTLCFLSIHLWEFHQQLRCSLRQSLTCYCSRFVGQRSRSRQWRYSGQWFAAENRLVFHEILQCLGEIFLVVLPWYYLTWLWQVVTYSLCSFWLRAVQRWRGRCRQLDVPRSVIGAKLTATFRNSWHSSRITSRFVRGCKVKVNVDLYSALLWTHLRLRCSDMARVFKGPHSFTCTPRVHLLTEWTIPAFTFPAKAGTHLPTPEGWKAELALSVHV